VPHARARRRRRRRLGQAHGCGRGRGQGEARRGRQAASGWAGVARFCHLIHIITGISLFYGGGELIATVTISSCLRLLSSSAGFLPPYHRHKSRRLSSVQHFPSLPREHISVVLWFSPSRISMHTEQRESRCLRNPRPPANLAQDVQRLGF
jgi:hypothetical protein